MNSKNLNNLTMQSAFIKIFLILSFATSCFADGKYFTKLETPFDLPSIQIQSENDLINLHDPKFDLILVNLWATWCQPCVSEMPFLDKLLNRINKEKKNYKIIALSQDDGGLKIIKNFYEKMGIHNLKIFIDNRKQFYNLVSPNGLPTTYLIKNNQIIGFYQGILNDDEERLLNDLDSFF